MKPVSKSPSYLIRNPYSYCFRMVIPKDLKKLLGKKELRYSLGTGYVGVAKCKARFLAGQIQLLFRLLRKRGTALGELSDVKIDELVRQYIKDSVKRWDKKFLNVFDDDHPPAFVDGQTFHSYYGELGSIREDLIVNMNLGDYSMLETTVARLLKENGIDIEEDSLEYRKFCIAMHDAQIKLLPLEQRHMIRDLTYKDQLPDVFPDVFPRPKEVPQIASEQSGDPLSEVIKKYIADPGIKRTEKTKAEVHSSLKLFLDYVGDVPVQSINRRNVSEFRHVLMKLPINRSKDPRYRGKSITEILEMERPKKLSISTVGKELGRVGTLFQYAIDNGFYNDPNPATRLNPKDSRQPHEKRAPYDEEELKRLFQSKEYLEDKHTKPYQFWTPILALFTGARQNELAQLHLTDIRQDDDSIWVIDLKEEEGTKKKLKTKSSRRIIPIHPFLLEDLKLPAYVEQLKKRGEKRLFPELIIQRDGYARNVSRWFNTAYKKRCGIVPTDERKKDFHSFRATLSTRLRHLKVDERMIDQIRGKSPGKGMGAVYNDPFPPKQVLEEAIMKLEHYGIDLSHLKKSKYVVRSQ